MRHLRKAMPAALLLVAFAPAPLAGENDGIVLTLQKTVVPGEVRIDFSGKTPSYVVYRSIDPLALPGVASQIAVVPGSTYIDRPLDDLVFYQASSLPPVLSDLMPAANDLAGYLETYRELPASTPYGTGVVNPAEFLHLASRTIAALASPDPFPTQEPPAGITLPADPYPAIDLQDDFFDRASSKDEYVALFRQIAASYDTTGAYPESLVVDGTTAEVRFDQMVHWAAGLIRARQMLGALPEHWTRTVISPIDLVPWDVPDGYEEYTAALESPNGIPFFATGARRYYQSSADLYAMLKRGREIYGNTRNAYRAGEMIFDWVSSTWQSTVGYSSGRTPFHNDLNAWGMANHFFHTSGVPRRITSGLFRANGLPASYSGAAYFQNRGWVNIDVHAPYGSDPLANPFYYDGIPPPTQNMPYPAASHDFVVEINDLVAHPFVEPAAGEVTTIYVNPRDVLDYGATWVLDHLGDVDAVILTVKTVKGNLYYSGSGWPEREVADALGPLLAEAHARGVLVYGALNTLEDSLTASPDNAIRQKLNDTDDGTQTYPNIDVSPCVASYRTRMTDLVTNLVAAYDVDGVVLESLYYANLFGNTDTVGHPDCPTGTDWMAGVITDYVDSLATAIRAVDPGVSVVVTSFPAGRNNDYPPLNPADWGWQDMASLAAIADEILLAFTGTHWTHSDPPPWVAVIDDFHARTGRAPWVSVHLTDEWEFTSRYYRGVANLARAHGIAGFNLHTALSPTGQLAPALTRPQWQKLSRIRLDD